MRIFGPTNTHGTASAPMQWLYQKRKLRAWRVQKCIALVGADVALTSAGPHTTPCHGGQYRVHQGNMRNFGPTNTHGTASAPMQWLYQKEATGMESSKMYCPSRCRCRTHQCGAANYPVSWGAVQGPPRKYAKLRAYQYPWYRVDAPMQWFKRKLRAWRVQKCIALVGADVALTSAGPQTTPYHGGSTGSTKEICKTSGLPIPMVPRLI